MFRKGHNSQEARLRRGYTRIERRQKQRGEVEGGNIQSQNKKSAPEKILECVQLPEQPQSLACLSTEAGTQSAPG